MNLDKWGHQQTNKNASGRQPTKESAKSGKLPGSETSYHDDNKRRFRRNRVEVEELSDEASAQVVADLLMPDIREKLKGKPRKKR